MARLAEAHIEQAKVLRAEGKSIREIVEILEATYKIKTYAGAVAKACKGVKGQNKRAYSRHADPQVPETKENAITDITAILEEIHIGYDSIFKYLRCELIKSRAQVNVMLKGAGLPEIDSEIK